MRSARAVGASLQLLLQAAIASTGNYTYFNLLTAVLALACFGPGRRRGGGGDGPAGAASAPAWPRRLERAASLALVSLAGVASARCFSTQPQLRLSLDVHTVPALLERYLPPLLKLHFRATLPAAALASAWRSRRRARPAAAVALGLLAAGGAAAVLGGLTAAPLRGLLRPDGRAAAALAAALPPPPPAWLGRAAEAARASSSYGLFRAMTGVGPAGEVARPELEFQGSASASGEGEGEEWHPIDFAYKPNGPPSAPRWVAPHQPRLDWQLWFAALGPPQRPPAWAAGLAARLLAGSADVWALLPPGGPFSAARPPARLRVVRWSLRFTTPAEAAASPGGRNWWVRSDPALWLAPVALGDPGLQAFLRARGWEGGGGGGEGASRRRPPSVGVIAGGLPWPCVAAAAAGAALVAAVCAAAAAAARGEEGRPCATSAARLRLARLKGE